MLRDLPGCERHQMHDTNCASCVEKHLKDTELKFEEVMRLVDAEYVKLGHDEGCRSDQIRAVVTVMTDLFNRMHR